MDKKSFKIVDSSLCTPFQKMISEALNLELIGFLGQYPDFVKRITFTENYTKFLSKRNEPKGCSPRGSLAYGSLERRLLNSALFELSEIIKKDDLIIDVGGGGERSALMGINKDRVSSLNIAKSPVTDYLEDIEGACASVPRNRFDIALCFGYLYMAIDPQKAVSNISSFLKDGGIAILDFGSLFSWYISHDGRHRHSYNPGSITDIISGSFSESVIVPIGNFFMAAMMYYSKLTNNRIAKEFLNILCVYFGKFDSCPRSARQYLVIARK